MVSSQNFSPPGVETNRDAGVIIEHPDIAKYFESVFLSDFKNKAKPFVAKGAGTQSKGQGTRSSSKHPAPKKKKPAHK